MIGFLGPGIESAQAGCRHLSKKLKPDSNSVISLNLNPNAGNRAPVAIDKPNSWNPTLRSVGRWITELINEID